MAWQDMVVPVDPGPAQPAVNLGGGVTSPATAAPETPAVPTVTVRPAKPTLAPDVLTKKAVDLGYAPGGAAGITQNILRESGGDPTQIGDSGTSAGLFQHHNERRAALEEFAKAQGKPADDPDVQFQFADQEMKRDYPKLRAKLMDPATTPAEAEQLFRTIFERPKAGSGPGGAASIDAPNFKWSDYALKQYQDRPDTDVVWMKPSDYLDLTPDLGDTPRTSKQYRELQASLAKGEPIEEIPSLEVSTGPSGAKVTDQDGRHRALAAQEAGIDLIPVAVKYPAAGKPSGLEAVGMGPTGKPKITELEGMTGKLLPFDFKPYAAKAAEPTGGRSALTGFGEGLRDPIEAGAQLLSHVVPASVERGVDAVNNWIAEKTGLLAPLPESGDTVAGLVKQELGVGDLGGTAMDKEVRAREHRIQAERGPDAGIDWSRMAGNVVATAPLAALAAPAAGAGTLATLAASAVGGAVGGATQPVTEGDFWSEKGKQVALGATVGTVAGAAGRTLASVVAPKLRQSVAKLLGEGVQLTPGQIAGGAAKRAEDSLASIPLLGSAIRAAQKKSLETFNRAAINRALEPIGQKLPATTPMGHDAVAEASKMLGAAYDQVIPKMVGQLDAPLQADLLNIARLGTNLPLEQEAELNSIIQHEILSRFSPGGGISGKTAQEIGSDLRPIINKLQQSDKTNVRRLAGAVKELRASLVRMMERTNPELTAKKKLIDQGYANYKVIEHAAQYQGASGGVFTPSQLSAAVRDADATLDNRAFAQGAARMQDLSEAAKDVLPRTVPDSGTPERAMLMGLVGGAVPVEPHVAAGLAASAVPYLPPVSRLTNALVRRLAQSPGPVRGTLAEILRHSGAALAPAAGSTAAGP